MKWLGYEFLIDIFFSKPWASKLGVRLLCKCSLYAVVYSRSSAPHADIWLLRGEGIYLSKYRNLLPENLRAYCIAFVVTHIKRKEKKYFIRGIEWFPKLACALASFGQVSKTAICKSQRWWHWLLARVKIHWKLNFIDNLMLYVSCC